MDDRIIVRATSNIALVKYMSDRVWDIIKDVDLTDKKDEESGGAHETLKKAVAAEKNNLNQQNVSNINNIFNDVATALQGPNSRQKKVLPVAQLTSLKTSLEKLWKDPLRATVAAHKISTERDSFITKAIGLHRAIDGIKEATDWAKLNPNPKQPLAHENHISVEVTIPKDGTRVVFRGLN